MKMMQGAAAFASLKRSRILLAPTPTNISTNSEPEIEKNGTPASPATARARSVLPVPGGPYSRTPFGIRAPSAWNFLGFARNSLISCSSSTASSTPATSRKPVDRHIGGHPLRLALAEAHDPTGAAAHPAHHEDPDRDDHEERKQRHEDRGPGRAVVRAGGGEIDLLRLQQVLELQPDWSLG